MCPLAQGGKSWQNILKGKGENSSWTTQKLTPDKRQIYQTNTVNTAKSHLMPDHIQLYASDILRLIYTSENEKEL